MFFWFCGPTISQLFLGGSSSEAPEASSCVPPLNGLLYSGIRYAFKIDEFEGMENWFDNEKIPESSPDFIFTLWHKRFERDNRKFMKMVMNITYLNFEPQVVIETTISPDLVKRWDKRTIERIELGDDFGKIPDVVSSIRPQNGSVAARSVISAKMHKFHKLSTQKNKNNNIESKSIFLIACCFI